MLSRYSRLRRLAESRDELLRQHCLVSIANRFKEGTEKKRASREKASNEKSKNHHKAELIVKGNMMMVFEGKDSEGREKHGNLTSSSNRTNSIHRCEVHQTQTTPYINCHETTDILQEPKTSRLNTSQPRSTYTSIESRVDPLTRFGLEGLRTKSLGHRS